MNSAFRQSYRSNFIAAALSEGLYAQLRDRPASLDQLYQHIVGARPNSSPSGEDFSREKLKAWLDFGVSIGELKLTPEGYSLRSRLSRQLAQPSNDGIAAMYEEVCTLHHDLLIQTPARLREKRFFKMEDADGRLIARSSRIFEPAIFEVVDLVIPASGAYSMLEIGCGSGVYIQRACLRNPDLRATGLELQPEVADFARQNLQAWGLADRVQVETGDIREYASPDRFDLVTLYNNFIIFPLSSART